MSITSQPGDAVISWNEFDDATHANLQRISQLVKRVARVGRLAKLGQELNTFEASRVLKDGLVVVGELAAELGVVEEVVSRVVLAPSETAELEWAFQFERSLQDLEVEFGGRYPAYEVFPFEVRIDLSSASALINNRTVRVMRPNFLAKLIKGERDRLFSARFNGQVFMRGMEQAYELLTKAQGGLPVGVALRRAYEVLTLREGTAQYPLRLFAFDLYRLRYQTDMVYHGRKFILNPSRSPRGAIAVPKPGGGVDNLGSYELVEQQGE